MSTLLLVLVLVLGVADLLVTLWHLWRRSQLKRLQGKDALSYFWIMLVLELILVTSCIILATAIDNALLRFVMAAWLGGSMSIEIWRSKQAQEKLEAMARPGNRPVR